MPGNLEQIKREVLADGSTIYTARRRPGPELTFAEAKRIIEAEWEQNMKEPHFAATWQARHGTVGP